MKVTFPEWHDDARRLRDQGLPLAQIVTFLKDAGINVSESRVSQVTNKNWEDYAERDAVRSKAAKDETAAAKREGRLPDLKTVMKAAVAEWWKEKQAMADRHFEMVSSPDPTDTGHRVRIHCSHEGCDKALIFVRRGVINPVHAAKWFRDKGWFVSSDSRKDLCDDHNPKSNHHKHANGGANIVMRHEDIQDGTVQAVLTATAPPQPEHYAIKTPADLPPIHPLKSEPVYHNTDMSTDKVMGRADRRVIHNKLEDVYVDEFIGYRTDWSDQKVSIDLGCPLVWVATVREENFGPEVTGARKKAELIRLGDDIQAKVTELKTEVIPTVAGVITRYDTIVDEIDAALIRYDDMQNALTASLLEFNTKLKELKDE